MIEDSKPEITIEILQKYCENISDRLEISIQFTEYIAEKLSNEIEYSKYVADMLDKSISYSVYVKDGGMLSFYDYLSQCGFNKPTSYQYVNKPTANGETGA